MSFIKLIKGDALLPEKFIYNRDTNKLHIEGYCCHTKRLLTNKIEFNNENDALAYDGRAVSLCKLCQKEREKRGS